MSKAVRVFLADDHPITHLGLRVLLEHAPDIEVVAEAERGEEALAKILALQPDVAVLDCQLPGLSGPEVAREIRQRGLPTRVLALSAYRYEHYVRRMLEAGAVGYLLKEEAPGAIVEAVRRAAQGGMSFSPGVAKVARAILESTGEVPRQTERAHPAARKTAHRRVGVFPPDSGDPPPDAGRTPRLGAHNPSSGIGKAGMDGRCSPQSLPDCGISAARRPGPALPAPFPPAPTGPLSRPATPRGVGRRRSGGGPDPLGAGFGYQYRG